MTQVIPTVGVIGQRALPECWGHRGASAVFPENTLASFEAAMRDGAEGIESDVHVSRDGVVLMFHDPNLERTTNFKGEIKEKDWYGDSGMQHAQTTKEPKQNIPTFEQTIELLMKPENLHVKFNVDVKVQNDPARLFSLMHKVISAQENWEATLAPRIILGLWHPKFIAPAQEHLKYLTLAHIGISPWIARTYFWDSCNSFSIRFASLATFEGERFRNECRKAGKKVMVWTVNKREEMMEAVRWNVYAILTDVTKVWLDYRNELTTDFRKFSQASRLFLWTNLNYYTGYQIYKWYKEKLDLTRKAGPFLPPPRTVLVA